VSKFIVASTIASAAIVLAFAPTVSAGGNDPGVINFGSCMDLVLVEHRPELAPGQTGVGPLTIVNGKIIFPPSVTGAIGCNNVGS
jgi:hypothetical protein